MQQADRHLLGLLRNAMPRLHRTDEPWFVVKAPHPDQRRGPVATWQISGRGIDRLASRAIRHDRDYIPWPLFHEMRENGEIWIGGASGRPGRRREPNQPPQPTKREPSQPVIAVRNEHLAPLQLRLSVVRDAWELAVDLSALDQLQNASTDVIGQVAAADVCYFLCCERRHKISRPRRSWQGVQLPVLPTEHPLRVAVEWCKDGKVYRADVGEARGLDQHYVVFQSDRRLKPQEAVCIGKPCQIVRRRPSTQSLLYALPPKCSPHRLNASDSWEVWQLTIPRRVDDVTHRFFTALGHGLA